MSVCENCERLKKLLSSVAAAVAVWPTVTGLQTGCVQDHSLIPMAIRDAQNTFRDTIRRLEREARKATY